MSVLENLEDPVAIAVEQLDVAIELFLDRRSYIAALNLAVAAETLFEQGLKDDETALKWEFNLIDKQERVWPFFSIYSNSLPEKERLAAFREFKRRERNIANHGPSKKPNKKIARLRAQQRASRPSLKDAAEEAIERACSNASRLGIPASEAVRQYEHWFYENVVGY